jgi:hypothetical protein
MSGAMAQMIACMPSQFNRKQEGRGGRRRRKTRKKEKVFWCLLVHCPLQNAVNTAGRTLHYLILTKKKELFLARKYFTFGFTRQYMCCQMKLVVS